MGYLLGHSLLETENVLQFPMRNLPFSFLALLPRRCVAIVVAEQHTLGGAREAFGVLVTKHGVCTMPYRSLRFYVRFVFENRLESSQLLKRTEHYDGVLSRLGDHLEIGDELLELSLIHSLLARLDVPRQCVVHVEGQNGKVLAWQLL